MAPLTTAHIPALCARNDRLICYFDTPAGLVAQILVGAVMVAGIESVWHGLYDKTREIVSESFEGSDAPVLARGEEMGRFNMGSTIIMLFEKGRSHFLQEMVSESGLRMGQAIGELTESSLP